MNAKDAFTVVVTKNCRKYLKLCYQLSRPVDDNLLNQLGNFGIVEVVRFSKYAPDSRDFFKINCEDHFLISGTCNDTSVHVTISKSGDISIIQSFQNEIISWLSNKTATA